MPSLPLQTDAFILLRKPSAAAFRQLTVFSAEHGGLFCLQRVPARTAATFTALDLFDEAHLSLESSNQGRTWFLKEARVLARSAAIGRSYEALAAASRLAAIVARNPVPAESRARVYALLRRAFGAFAGPAPPGLVFFKSLYCFVRDEGYPVKQDWAQGLPDGLRPAAIRLLASPLAGLTAADARAAAPLFARFEAWVDGHTEILL